MKRERIVLMVVAAWFFKKLLEVVNKIRNFERLRQSIPVPKMVDNFILGMVKPMAKHYDSLFHMRLKLFDDVEKETGQVHDTVMLRTPIWRGEACLATRDPEVVRYMLKDDFDSWVKTDSFRSCLDELLHQGIFNLNHGSTSKDNASWTFQRKTAAKIFTKNIFTGHVHSTLIKNTNKFISLIETAVLTSKRTKSGGVSFEMKKPIYSFTMDSIGNIGFGVDLDTLSIKEVVPFSKAFDDCVKFSSRRFVLPGWNVFGDLLYSGEKIIKEGKKILDDFAFDIIEKRTFREKYKGKGDILSLFLQADPTLSKSLLRDVVMSFMIAGRDTTASTLSFLFFLLATHPEIQDKLFAEIEEILKVREEEKQEVDAPVTLDTLKEMPYLDGVVFETLRLFCPVPTDPKQAAKDTVLPNGVRVPKGTTMTYEPFAMGRNERVYKEAGSFKPERWLGRENQSFDQYSFPVFQAGNRICIGKDLALFEVKFLAFELLRRYRFELAQEIENKEQFYKDVSILNEEFIYQAGITMSFKKDINLNVYRRS